MYSKVSLGTIAVYGYLIKKVARKSPKRATKLIPTIKTMIYTERLKDCKSPTLHYRHILEEIMIEMYKI